MVSAMAPGTYCVPPTPNPTPPTGVSGTGTFAAAQAGPLNKQIFERPLRPMEPPTGGVPEMPVRVPVRFARPEIRTD